MPSVCDCRGPTSTRISSMEVALYLQSVAFVDRQGTIIDTSTDISSMEVALCLQSVAVVDRQATFTDSSVPSVCGCRRPTSHFYRYFH